LQQHSNNAQNENIENNMILKDDSIVILRNSGAEIFQIPIYIMRDSTIVFSTGKNQSISVKQINYSEIKFSISFGNEKVEGRASLLPHFYLGSETIGLSDGEYYITKYFVTESTNQCIDHKGIDDQNSCNITNNCATILLLLVV
jgi:hypothetical protein